MMTWMDVYAEFRRALEDRHAFPQDQELRSRYKTLVRGLYLDTLRKCYTVVTTLSNTADIYITTSHKAQLVITDEFADAVELELHLPLVNNSKVDDQPLSIHVGDYQQLRPVVKSKGAKLADGTIANPFAEQLTMPFMQRMVDRGHEILTLTEQHRAVEGLEEVYNKIFYRRVITNGPEQSFPSVQKPKNLSTTSRDTTTSKESFPTSSSISQPVNACSRR